MKSIYSVCLFASLVIAQIYSISDEICFSFNRAGQLEAHLESVKQFITGLDTINSWR